MSRRRDDRLEELLAGRALGDLDTAEDLELETLLCEHPEADPESYESTLTTLMLSMLGPIDPLPRSLRERLHEAGRETIQARRR